MYKYVYICIGCTLHAFRQNRTDVAMLQHILSYYGVGTKCMKRMWFAAQHPVPTGINIHKIKSQLVKALEVSLTDTKNK